MSNKMASPAFTFVTHGCSPHAVNGSVSAANASRFAVPFVGVPDPYLRCRTAPISATFLCEPGTMAVAPVWAFMLSSDTIA